MFHKEGYQIIMTSFLIAALIAIGSEYKIDNFILRTVFQIFSLLQLILVLQFFRNPIFHNRVMLPGATYKKKINRQSKIPENCLN